jgi:pilus assembly protein CpaF
MAAGMLQAAVHSQLASAVDAVVHLARGSDGVRRVAEVAALRRAHDGRVVAEPAVTFSAVGGTREHPAAAHLGERLRR